MCIPLSVECHTGFAKCRPEREHPALRKLLQHTGDKYAAS